MVLMVNTCDCEVHAMKMLLAHPSKMYLDNFRCGFRCRTFRRILSRRNRRPSCSRSSSGPTRRSIASDACCNETITTIHVHSLDGDGLHNNATFIHKMAIVVNISRL